jgi:hypothetical protein
LLEATTIYVVEPKYLDSHTKKVNPTLEINPPKQTRGVQEVDQRNQRVMTKNTRETHDNRSDVNGDATTSATEIYPSNSYILLSWEGRSEEWYEAVAMDYPINARERGLCLHKVTEEYFGNDKIGNRFHYLCFVALFSSLPYRKGSDIVALLSNHGSVVIRVIHPPLFSIPQTLHTFPRGEPNGRSRLPTTTCKTMTFTFGSIYAIGTRRPSLVKGMDQTCSLVLSRSSATNSSLALLTSPTITRLPCSRLSQIKHHGTQH